MKTAKKQNRFGIEKYHSGWLGGWWDWAWYPTARARDQALDMLVESQDTGLTTEYRKINRP